MKHYSFQNDILSGTYLHLLSRQVEEEPSKDEEIKESREGQILGPSPLIVITTLVTRGQRYLRIISSKTEDSEAESDIQVMKGGVENNWFLLEQEATTSSAGQFCEEVEKIIQSARYFFCFFSLLACLYSQIVTSLSSVDSLSIDFTLQQLLDTLHIYLYLTYSCLMNVL